MFRVNIYIIYRIITEEQIVQGGTLNRAEFESCDSNHERRVSPELYVQSAYISVMFPAIWGQRSGLHVNTGAATRLTLSKPFCIFWSSSSENWTGISLGMYEFKL